MLAISQNDKKSIKLILSGRFIVEWSFIIFPYIIIYAETIDSDYYFILANCCLFPNVTYTFS